MNPVGTAEFAGIGAPVGEGDRQHGGGAVIGRGHGVEGSDLVRRVRIVLDLDVALVVGPERRLGTLQVVVDRGVRVRSMVG